jgi:hypothetical protein
VFQIYSQNLDPYLAFAESGPNPDLDPDLDTCFLFCKNLLLKNILGQRNPADFFLNLLQGSPIQALGLHQSDWNGYVFVFFIFWEHFSPPCQHSNPVFTVAIESRSNRIENTGKLSKLKRK